MHRRIALATSSLVVLAGAGAAAVSAQDAPRTVVITVGPRSVAVTGTEGLPAGPTRVEIRRRGNAQVEGVLLSLRPGRTLAQLQRALPRARRGPTPLKRVVGFEAGGSPAARGSYVTTIDLRAGVTYVAANIPEPLRLRNVRLASFTVGTTPTTAVRPVPDATVGMYDYAYGMTSVLPRDGVVRFENRGERLHMAIAFPVRRGANRAAAVQAFLRNQERRAGRLLDFRRGFEALGTVSPGTVNDVQVDFGRGGNWAFACFVEDGEPGSPGHYTLGMVKAFRVR